MSQRPGGALPPPNMPKVTYSITGQVEVPGPGPDGRLTDGYRVSFRTQGGTNATVFVPRAQYTPANVAAAIAAHAYQLDQVNQLGS